MRYIGGFKSGDVAMVDSTGGSATTTQRGQYNARVFRSTIFDRTELHAETSFGKTRFGFGVNTLSTRPRRALQQRVHGDRPGLRYIARFYFRAPASI